MDCLWYILFRDIGGCDRTPYFRAVPVLITDIKVDLKYPAQDVYSI